MVTSFTNCVLVVLVGTGQGSRVPFALFNSKICCLEL